MTKKITDLVEVTQTDDGDLLLIRDATDGVDKKMQAQNLRAKATTKADVGLGNVPDLDTTDAVNKAHDQNTDTALDQGGANEVTAADARAHIDATDNPHGVTKAQVGLSDVDNVSAADLRDRSTHTGTQTLSTISDAGTAASEDVTTSATDTTAGRLLKVGDFGAGLTSLVGTPFEYSDADATAHVFHPIRFNSTTTNTPVAGQFFNGFQAGGGSLFDWQVVVQNRSGAQPIDIYTRQEQGNAGYTPWYKLYHTGNIGNIDVESGDFSVDVSGSPDLFIQDGTGNVGIGITSPSWVSSGTQTNQGVLSLGSMDPTITTNDVCGALSFVTVDSSYPYADGVTAQISSGSQTSTGGSWYLSFLTGGTSDRAERMRIDSSGNVQVATTDTSPSFVGSDGICLFHEGRVDAAASSTAAAAFGRNGSSGVVVVFRRDGATVGDISVTTTSTSYNTSSDYRLKENAQPITGALARVQAMNPVRYNWKADDSEGEGFIAHELQEVVPYAVSGEKDGEEMQGVDYGKLTTLLTAAIKELKAELDELKGAQ